MKIVKLIVCSMILVSCIKVKAQQNTLASGGDASGTTGNISYSIGQIDFSSSTGSGGNLSEGVQQPYKISITTGAANTTINLSCAIYPNPAINYVVLSVENTNLSGMHYQLFDLQGKLISEKEISENKSTIQLDELNSAVYFIKVLNAETEIKIFQLIKN